jgi:hypothetical protein
MNGKIHRQYWWMQGICGLNRSKMPKQQLEKDKQYGNEETHVSQRRN